MQFRRPLVIGPLWGLLQTAIILLMIYGPILALGPDALTFARNSPGSDPTVIYIKAQFQFALWLAVCLSLLIGYWLEDFQKDIKAALLAQLIAFISNPLLISAFLLLPPPSLFAIGLVILLLFIGLISSLVGSLLWDWLQPPRPRLLGGRPVGLGMMILAIAVLLPVSPPVNGVVSPLTFGSWSLLITGVLILAGVVSIIRGSRSKNSINSEMVGFLMIATVLLAGFSTVSLGFADGVYEFSSGPDCLGNFCPVQAQEFLVTMLLLVASLIVSLGTFFSCAFSRQAIVIVETLARIFLK